MISADRPFGCSSRVLVGVDAEEGGHLDHAPPEVRDAVGGQREKDRG
jgi:hypothetical protein